MGSHAGHESGGPRGPFAGGGSGVRTGVSQELDEAGSGRRRGGARGAAGRWGGPPAGAGQPGSLTFLPEAEIEMPSGIVTTFSSFRLPGS